MYLKLRYIYFHPMGMLYCCHVTGKLTPKPVLIRNNGIMRLRLRFSAKSTSGAILIKENQFSVLYIFVIIELRLIISNGLF